MVHVVVVLVLRFVLDQPADAEFDFISVDFLHVYNVIVTVAGG